MFQNKLGECPYLYGGIIYMLETKVASVAKRMPTAMFMRNDIHSKYTDFSSKMSIMLLYTIDTMKNPVRYLFLVHTSAGFLYSLYV